MKLRNKHLFFIGILFVSLISCNKNLTCSDFKTGTFYIPKDNLIEKYTINSNDSIKELKVDRDEDIKKWLVIRKKGTQTEWANGLNIGNPKHIIIEWINDCSYRLTYNKNKGKLDTESIWVNKQNGIVVESIKISGRCMEYLATMTTNDGQKISQKGTICKD